MNLENKKMHKNANDLTGSTFGEWTVSHRGPNSLSGKTRYFCKCSCGKDSLVFACNLTSGKSKYCIGCSNSRKVNYHGMSKSKTYSVYIQMIERCHNVTHKYYPYYGGRGIFVCSRWIDKFTNFLEDMGEAPDKYSIDRINNYEGYSKNNCRWATKLEQQRNRRNSIKVGEICNDWTVYELIKEKKYRIMWANCRKFRSVLSCNFRNTVKCNCLKEGAL